MPALWKRLATALWSTLLLFGFCLAPMAVSAHPNSSPIRLSARSFNTGLYAVQRITISHDGRIVAFLGYISPSGVSREFGVSIFDIASEKLLARLDVNAVRPQILQGGVAFSPDDQTLAAGADIISLWDVKTWHLKEQIAGPFASGSYAARGLLNLSFSPNGGRIIGLYDRVWAPSDLRVATAADSVRLSEGVRQAYQTGIDPQTFQRAEIQIFDIASTTRLERFAIAREGQRGDRDILTSDLYISRDGSAAFVGLIDRDGLPSPPSPTALPRASIQKVDLATGNTVEVLDVQQDWMFTTFSVSSSERLIATGEREGEKVSAAGDDWHINTDPIRIWAAFDGHLIGSLGSQQIPLWKLAFLPDAKHLLSCQTGAKNHELLSIWDVQNQTITGTFNLETRAGATPTCALAPDGGRAVFTLETGVAFGGVRPDTAFVVGLLTSG